MRLVLLLFSLVAFLVSGPESGHADTLTTTVIDVLEPEKPGDSWIFLLSADGRALRVDDKDLSRIEILRSHVGKPRFIRIDFTNLGPIDQINSLEELSHVQAEDPFGGFPIEPASVISDPLLGRIDFEFSGYSLTPQGLYDYFRSFRLRRGSQCFHRAYYWAHQLWRQSGALTHKVFMFFTGKYIRRYNYHWWFHVAPYVYDEEGKEVVIDPTFLKQPVDMQKWTDNFLRNDPVCPEVKTYQGHYVHARDQWCYVVKASMHYYHPNTIEEANKKAKKINTWDKGWLSNARRSR